MSYQWYLTNSFFINEIRYYADIIPTPGFIISVFVFILQWIKRRLFLSIPRNHETKMNPGKSVNKNPRSFGFLISNFPKLKKLGTGPLPKNTTLANPNYEEPEKDDNSWDQKAMDSHSSFIPKDIKSFNDFMRVYNSFHSSLIQSRSYFDRSMFTEVRFFYIK